MALSATEKEYIRDNSGDDLVPYEVSDTSLQTIYDSATQGNGDLDKVIVFVLRRRLGKAVRLTSISGEFGSAQHNQKYENLEKLLRLWETITGLGSGGVTVGEMGLGLDMTEDDLT